MALWGVTDSDESRPKYLKQADKNNCVAKAEGWVLKKSDGSRNLEEVLVAVGSNTNLATALGNADITGVYFDSATYSQGDAGKVIVVYNENVDVTNGATLTVGAVIVLKSIEASFKSCEPMMKFFAVISSSPTVIVTRCGTLSGSSPRLIR